MAWAAVAEAAVKAGQAAEVAQKVSAVNEVKSGVEIANASSKMTAGFNPSKRIDVKGKKGEPKPGDTFNPSKRISQEKPLTEAQETLTGKDSPAGETKDIAKNTGSESSVNSQIDKAKEISSELGNEEVAKLEELTDVEKAGLKDAGISENTIAKEIGEMKDASKEIGDAVKEYVDDLKSKSPCADTISADCIDASKLEVQSPEKVKQLRKEFSNTKNQLRNEWSKVNNREWPTYKEDVLNSRGEVIRKAGDKLDAHHKQPLQLGGENTVSNITPLDIAKHQEIHSSTGSCKKLVDVVSGGKV